MRFLLLFLALVLPAKAALTVVRVPAAEEAAAARPMISSELVKYLNLYPTNVLDADAPVLANFLGRFGTNTYTTNTIIFGGVGGINVGLTNGTIVGATITQSTFSGTILSLTNGVLTTTVLVSPTFTNAINYGNAFSSPGSGGSGAEQFGLQAEATGLSSFAAGSEAKARAGASTAVGNLAYVATNAYGGLALGLKTGVFGGKGTAIGTGAETYETNGMAFGNAALSIHTNSYAFGTDVTTTAADQIRLGTSTHTLSVPGDVGFGQRLSVGSDNFLSWPGGMNRGIAFANGASPSDPATNSWVLYSEASQAFYRSGSVTEGAEANNRLHNRGAQVTGSGSTYALTASTARIDLGGQDSEILLPTAGTYLVTALVEILNGATANDEYRLKLVNSTDLVDIANSERATSSMAASVLGQLTLQNVITVDDSKLIELWGFNATAARGTIQATRTSLTYVRLY